MENFFVRYKNPLALMAVLLVQVLVLATQVKRPDPKSPNSSIRLIRVWAVTAATPFEKAFVGTGHFFRNSWHNYVDMRGMRKQNAELQAEVDRLRLEQAQLKEDAQQVHRLQALLDFREKFIHQTLAAQVIGTSGSETSHVITIDKGSLAGLKTDMAVVTPDGIVGKVKDVFPLSSQVLMISDRESGAGVILEKSRLQGVLRGSSLGDLRVDNIMSDEHVEAGDRVLTSGGDRIYPKGLPVGAITSVMPDRENFPFLAISVKPAANLNRLEEVLVVTKVTEVAPTATSEKAPSRASDILAQHLPSAPKVETKSPAAAPGTSNGPGAPTPSTATPNKKKESGATVEKPRQQKPLAAPKPDDSQKPPRDTETPPR